MSIDTALERYFDAWNSHQPALVPAALTDGGTYEDPTTGGPLSGDALTASVAGVVAAFPDVHFEIDRVATNGDTASAQWRMLGTNTGPLPGGPATGGSLDLRGDAHSNAMKLAQSGGLGDDARGVTSAWTPHFLNGVFTPQSGSRDLSELGGQWL